MFCSPKDTISINEKPVIDQDIIFSRAMILNSTGELDIKTLFASELAIYPLRYFLPMVSQGIAHQKATSRKISKRMYLGECLLIRTQLSSMRVRFYGQWGGPAMEQ